MTCESSPALIRLKAVIAGHAVLRASGQSGEGASFLNRLPNFAASVLREYSEITTNTH